MRIIAGEFKGRPIAAPKGQSTRPTGGRTREAVFNLISHAAWAPTLDGARVIDLFAGSGALGLEAMSRGAAFCVFVETDAGARGTDLGPVPAGVGEPFNIAFLDPPYHKGLVEPALSQLAKGGWLAADAIAIVETAADEMLAFDGWERLDERIYGAAKVSFLKPA